MYLSHVWPCWPERSAGGGGRCSLTCRVASPVGVVARRHDDRIEGDPYGDFDVFAVSAFGSVSVEPEVALDDEWNADWQPIPAFPLVDAKLSPFKCDIEALEER